MFSGAENTISLASFEPAGKIAEPTSVLIPPPFLIDMSTGSSESKFAYHKLASAVKLPKFVSCVLTWLRLPSKKTLGV